MQHAFDGNVGFCCGIGSNPFLWRILQSWEEARYCNAIETLLCIPRVVAFIFNQTLGNRHSSRPAALLGSAGKREAGIHIGWASCGGRRIDETTIIVTVSSSALSPKPYKAKPRSFCQATSSIKAVCLDMVHGAPQWSAQRRARRTSSGSTCVQPSSVKETY